MIISLTLVTAKLRRFIFRALQRVSARYLRDVRIERWPKIVSQIYGVKTPRGTVAQLRKTASCSANINIIFELLQQTGTVGGDVAECGVFRGATFIPMALYLKQQKMQKTLLGFDSFQGFDESVIIDVELGGEYDGEKRVAGFNDTSYTALTSKLDRLDLSSMTRLVKGYFRDTLPLHQDRHFSFVHLDCDIYQSYYDCLEFFYPRMEIGGIILLDEYNDPHWPGCNGAVDAFMADKPEKLIEAQANNCQKWYFKKEEFKGRMATAENFGMEDVQAPKLSRN